MQPEYLPLALAATIFFTVLFAAVGILQIIRTSSRKQALMQKAQAAGHKGSFAAPGHAGGDAAAAPGIAGFIAGLLDRLGRRLPRDKAADHTLLRPRFLKAGIRSDKAPAVFWGSKAALAVLLPLGYIFFRVSAPHIVISPGMSIGVMTILGLAGFYIPNLWLTHKIQQRRQKILEGFPDALDLLVVCVEAGMGLDGAMNRVSRESRSSNKVLSDELHLFNLEIRAGMQRKEALKNLAMRTDLEEVHNLVTLLIQTDRFGTSVSQALKVYSDTLRNQRFQRAEEKAAKLPVKLLFPLILFIFPALFVIILGPAAIRIYQTLLQM